MFQDLGSAEEHKDSIAGTMRSAVVCLHMLLKMKNNGVAGALFEKELFSNPNLSVLDNSGQRDLIGLSHEVAKDDFIVENLSEILFNEKCDGFIQKFIGELHANELKDDAECFVERLGIARSLPVETKNQVRGIITALKTGTGQLFDWIFSSFMENEHSTTQCAFMELISSYFPVIANMHNSHANQNPLNVNCYGVHHSRNISYAYLWGDIPDGQETPEQLELVTKRIEFIQAFKAGILDQKEKDWVWKFKEPEAKCSLEEINTMLAFSAKFPVHDFSEQLSLTLDVMDDPIVDAFKGKLNKSQLKLKQC